MMRALYTAATGMLAQQTNVDNISNNLFQCEYGWIQAGEGRV